ncbi:hypothetical protein JCM3765_004339 [Sporobolomyces pararoseus]
MSRRPARLDLAPDSPANERYGPSTSSADSNNSPFSDSDDSQSSLASANTSNAPRLPIYLQEKILRILLGTLQEEDPATVIKKFSYLPSLSQVSRIWELIVGLEYVNYGCLDLRDRGGKENKKDKPRETKDLLKPLAAEERWAEDLAFAPGTRCDCCFQVNRPGPKLLINGHGSILRSTEWRKAMNQVLVNFSHLKQLELLLFGTDAGNHIDICQRFSRVKFLLVASAEAYVPIDFKPQFFFSSISTTLARLDFAKIIIRDWQLRSLPAVRTLTLSFVRFQSGESPSPVQEVDNNNEANSSPITPNEILCRNFFDSFKNLKALGIEGIENLSPPSLSRLRVFSIERLFVGDPRLGSHLHNSDDCTRCFLSIPLASPLTRFFHCQIKHLFLSPRQNSLPLLQSLLATRTEQLCPAFLRRLETIKLAVPLSEDQDSIFQEHQLEWRKAELEEEVQNCLREANLKDVEIKWWCPVSYENSLQGRILRFLFEILQDEGPADARKTIQYLPPLSLVSRSWEQIVRSYYPNWLAFDMRERVKLINGGFDMLDGEQMEENIRAAAQAGCACSLPTGRGSLKLLIDGPELGKHSKSWQKLLNLILLNFSDFKRLNLELFGDSQSLVEVCRRFTSLKKLFIRSAQHPLRLTLVPASIPSSSCTTLTRLDLANVVIGDWQLSLPSLRTLTLFFVSFGTDTECSAVSSESDICLSFFDSFPNLRSLGLEGIKNLHPSSLSRLRVFSVTRLYLGDPEDSTDGSNFTSILPSFSRYFHAQVRHLVFSPLGNSIPLLRRLGLGRGGRAPPFLKRLQSVKLARPKRCDCGSEHERWQEEAKQEAERLFTLWGLTNVEIKWWKEVEENTVNYWEPSE